ncbi:MAG: hypothetical protein ACXABY_21865 [Candidatus Thorarchaeota archaeon]|jgi:hypothetical protein
MKQFRGSTGLVEGLLFEMHQKVNHESEPMWADINGVYIVMFPSGN